MAFENGRIRAIFGLFFSLKNIAKIRLPKTSAASKSKVKDDLECHQFILFWVIWNITVFPLVEKVIKNFFCRT